MKFIMTMLLMASSFHQGLAQRIDLSKSRLDAINVYMSVEKFGKKTIVKVAKDSTVKEVDEPTFVKLHGINFQDGTIEVNVLNKLLPNASESTADSLVLLFTSTMIIPNLNVSISVPPMAGLKIRRDAIIPSSISLFPISNFRDYERNHRRNMNRMPTWG